MKNYVTINGSRVEEALDWAKTHCPNYITIDVHSATYSAYEIYYDFYFVAESKDITLFALRWA